MQASHQPLGISAMKLLDPMSFWPGVSQRIWVVERMFSSMSSVKCVRLALRGLVSVVGTVFSLNPGRWGWPKAGCKCPTSWLVFSIPLRFKRSTLWLNWVQILHIMLPSMSAPASQVRHIFCWLSLLILTPLVPLFSFVSLRLSFLLSYRHGCWWDESKGNSGFPLIVQEANFS